jgi:hypothetical protein
LHAVQTKESRFVRQSGKMTKRDLENPGQSRPTLLLDPKLKLVFGTESTFLFLRLYALLCGILADLREHCDAIGPTVKDPVASYYKPVHPNPRRPRYSLGYGGIMNALKATLSGQLEVRQLEAFCRKVSKSKLYRMIALPRLVERCADAFLRASRDDVLLQLFDLCQPVECVADLGDLRKACFAVAPGAVFRIQYDPLSNSIAFAYLPENEDMALSPLDDIEEDEGGGDQDKYSNGNDDVLVNGQKLDTRDSMDVEEDSIDEYSDGPAQKRPKFNG